MATASAYVRHPDGTTLYYETCIVEAAAPVAFLVHGIGGDVDGWRFVRDRLVRAGISTVALDVRGHGYSDHPRESDRYGMSRMLEDIALIIDAEKLDRVYLVGHSGGAVIALHFALAYPERLAGLVLVAGSHRPPAYMRFAAVRSIARALIAVGAFVSPPAMKPWHSTYPEGTFNREYEPWGLVRTIAHNSLRSYLLVGHALMNISVEEELAQLDVPTVLISGEKDTIYPLSIARAMQQGIKGARLEVIAGANHVLILNNPDETARHIIDFIQVRADN